MHTQREAKRTAVDVVNIIAFQFSHNRTTQFSEQIKKRSSIDSIDDSCEWQWSERERKKKTQNAKNEHADINELQKQRNRLGEISGEKPTTKSIYMYPFAAAIAAIIPLEFISLYLILTPQGINRQIL